MATESAMSLTPRILIHSSAISEVLTLNIFLANDTTTRLRDLSWQELTGHASKPYNNNRHTFCHFVADATLIISYHIISEIYSRPLLREPRP